MGKLTDIALKDKLYLFLKEKGLDLVVSGRIYKDARPANSLLEDVEIAVLTGDASQVQEFIVNVNVFVPDIKRGDELIENTARLRTLCGAFLDALDHSVFDGYHLRLAHQRVMKVEDAGLHCINNRIAVSYLSE